MGLPKEPRQKMINMMYLVLTALLALNVSNEILNAFKTVDKSLVDANEVLTGSNTVLAKSIQEKLNDSKTQEKAKIWEPKAKLAMAYSEAVYKYIDQLKDSLKRGSGYNPEKGDTSFKEDDLEAPTRMLDEEGRGEVLRKKMESLRADLLKIDPEIAQEFAKKLPIDLHVPHSEFVKDASWSTAYFHMTPTIAALTILSKFQNDVKNAENQVVTFCHNKIDQVALRFDRFEPLANSSSSYVMPGDKLTISAGVGAFSSAAQPTVIVDGREVKLNNNGIAQAELTAGGSGPKKVHVVIKYKDQDGKDQTIQKDVDYTVGIPSGSSMFLEKMNVVYLDVENPVLISAGSAGKENMKVSFTNGSISGAGGDHYNIVPTTAGIGKVNITVNGKTTPFEVRCKPLPSPVAMIAGKTSGAIPSAEFKAQGGIMAKLKDSEFDFPYKVLSYRIGARNSGGIVQEIPVDGPRWTAASALISSQAPGSIVYFDQIIVLGPGGKKRSIEGIFFTLK
jgi:gliding motility-associated protein GldM